MAHLEGQISELVKSAESKTAEIAALKMEIKRLVASAGSSNDSSREETIKNLTAENQQLKVRLVAMSAKVNSIAISDTEKDLLLKGHQKCSSAPPSIVGPNEAWEKGSASSSALSEISVACLQDRIIQMEENHYCTNEELQATLQELNDLQDQLTDMKVQNEQLSNDKRVILESLYSQTEKLEDARSHNNSLKKLLLSKSGEGTLPVAEREQHLLDLLRSGQEEKEILLMKHAELEERLARNEASEKENLRETLLIRDRLKMLESTLECSQSERRLLEKQLREQRSRESAECSRLRRMLDAANARVQESESRTEGNKSTDESPTENEAGGGTRQEKDRLSSKVSRLTEELEASVAENAKFREQLLRSQEEGRLAKNKAAQEIHDLEFRVVEVVKEKADIVNHLTSRMEEMENLCQRHLEDKRELKAQIQSQLNENQKLINDYTTHIKEREERIDEVMKRHKSESEEWCQFQTDLLMTVRVANDFKTEAQQNLERLLQENRSLRDRIQSLEIEIDRIRCEKPAASPSPLSALRHQTSSADAIVSLERELQSRRHSRQSSSRHLETRVSVRSLIESIETSTRSSRLGSSCTSATPTSVTSPLSASACSSLAGSCASLPTVPPADGGTPASTTAPANGTSPSTAANTAETNQASTFTGPVPITPSSSKGDVPTGVFSLKATPNGNYNANTKPAPSILSKKAAENSSMKRPVLYPDTDSKVDPLAPLAKNGGSRRNALLKWCQMKTLGYSGIDITNFSSSWNDGLALCALIHSFLPDRVYYNALIAQDKRKNFQVAFAAAESVGINTTLDVTEMVTHERPDWQKVMAYVASIYIHFET